LNVDLLDFVGLLKHLALHLLEYITDVLEIRDFQLSNGTCTVKRRVKILSQNLKTTREFKPRRTRNRRVVGTSAPLDQ
jgi:hypothetical protein